MRNRRERRSRPRSKRCMRFGASGKLGRWEHLALWQHILGRSATKFQDPHNSHRTSIAPRCKVAVACRCGVIPVVEIQARQHRRPCSRQSQLARDCWRWVCCSIRSSFIQSMMSKTIASITQSDSCKFIAPIWPTALALPAHDDIFSCATRS